MLVLLRKVGETIVIGGRVLVTVLKVRRSSVSLGVTAAPGAEVDRKEVWEKKRQQSEGEVSQ
jgi:carbon storage regulator